MNGRELLASHFCHRSAPITRLLSLKMQLPTLCYILLSSFAASAAAGATGYHGRSIYVKAGDKIQKAINMAPAGSEIVVAPGTYQEQLLITKDGIHLRGQDGVILSPPKTTRSNICSGNFGDGTQAGVCIAGSGIEMDDFHFEHRKVRSVKRPVKDVWVSGFQVQDFSGANILALGADGTHIEHNKLIDASIYGFLTSGSKDTVADGNVITSSDPTAPGFIAMCMDNFSGMEGMYNKISAYAIGFCVQTDGAYLHDNDVSLTCSGAFVDPYVDGAKLTNNHFHDSYTQCGDFGTWGVALSGATNALVQGNHIEQIHGNGPTAGIDVADDPCTENALSCLDKPGVLVKARGNRVIGNTLSNNDLDILNASTGSGNVFKWNHCSSSKPNGLC